MKTRMLALCSESAVPQLTSPIGSDFRTLQTMCDPRYDGAEDEQFGAQLRQDLGGPSKTRSDSRHHCLRPLSTSGLRYSSIRGGCRALAGDFISWSQDTLE